MTTSAGKTRGRVRVEHGAKRIRAYVGGVAVADTVRPVLVWEVPYYPAYYFPLDDVRTELLSRTDGVVHSPSRGDAEHLLDRRGRREVAAAALRYADSPIPELRDLIRLDWDAMDAWFEEDEEVFTHPRDPYTRVDILAELPPCARRGRRHRRSPSRRRRGSCSRPACRRASTCPRRTSAWTCSSPTTP